MKSLNALGMISCLACAMIAISLGAQTVREGFFAAAPVGASIKTRVPVAVTIQTNSQQVDGAYR